MLFIGLTAELQFGRRHFMGLMATISRSPLIVTRLFAVTNSRCRSGLHSSRLVTSVASHRPSAYPYSL